MRHSPLNEELEKQIAAENEAIKACEWVSEKFNGTFEMFIDSVAIKEEFEKRDVLIKQLGEALALAKTYVEALNNNIAGAIGKDNTVVRPDLDRVTTALTAYEQYLKGQTV